MKRRRSTPEGTHRPVLLPEVLKALHPQPGEIAVDCTTGWAGHALELLRRVGPSGFLIGFDFDADNLPRARERLEVVGKNFHLHHGNYAGIDQVLAELQIPAVDMILADLGMSSMQVDDADRGFSYRREGPLDMRMDRTRGRTAEQLLRTLPEHELAQAFAELGDEPAATTIARAIVEARSRDFPTTTTQLAQLISRAVGQGRWRLHPGQGKWNLHPAARTFQALRILVNRELNNLRFLLNGLPRYLNPGGRVAIISFHSGEDRIVKAAFRDGGREGFFESTSGDPLRASFEERTQNPRSRSAKLRWAKRKSTPQGHPFPPTEPRPD